MQFCCDASICKPLSCKVACWALLYGAAYPWIDVVLAERLCTILSHIQEAVQEAACIGGTYSCKLLLGYAVQTVTWIYGCLLLGYTS